MRFLKGEGDKFERNYTDGTYNMSGRDKNYIQNFSK